MIKKILFDINVILDVLLAREHLVNDSGLCWTLMSQRKIHGYIAAHAVTTIDYLMRKHITKAKVAIILAELMEKFTVIELTHHILTEALILNFKDYEDAVTYCSGLSIEADAILTRNIKDFKSATTPIYTPKQFIIDWQKR